MFAEQDPTIATTPIPQLNGERECAWCLADRGITPETGTHGICQFHAAQIVEQSRKRRAERKVGNCHE